jgi:hypothetical protein
MIKVALLVVTLLMVMVSLSAPALTSTQHIEARLDPSTPLPDGTALSVRYGHGMEAWIGDHWQTIAVVNETEDHPDSGLLNYRLIIDQAHRVHASVVTVSIQYRMSVHE